MKNWLVFISVFVSLGAFSCGPWYPDGEEVRYSIFAGMPSFYPSFRLFEYENSSSFCETRDLNSQAKEDENLRLWNDYFHGKIDVSSLNEAIYYLSYSQIKEGKHPNKLVQLLCKPAYQDAKNYLLFAKNMSKYSTGTSLDPWEKEEVTLNRSINASISLACAKARKAKRLELKKRYAHLAIRLAYYSNQLPKVKVIYKAFFEGQKTKSAIDYWAMHFRYNLDKVNDETIIHRAEVFRYSNNKKLATYLNFKVIPSKDVKHALTTCNNEKDKANILALSLMQKLDPALENLKMIHQLDPDNPAFEFLVQREITKIEDWILTPYYTEFSPAIVAYSWENDFGEWNNSGNYEQALMRGRRNFDQSYARRFAQFIDQIKSDNAVDLKLYGLYAHWLSGEKINVSELRSITVSNENMKQFKERMYALTMVRDFGNAKLDDPLLQSILKREVEDHNDRFVFSIARELEFRGNKIDAAYLFASLNKSRHYYYDDIPVEKQAFWTIKGGNIATTYGYYDGYFFYLDDAYSLAEIRQVYQDLKSPINRKSSFDKWKKSFLQQQKDRVADLIGTKYIRLNQFDKALDYFDQVNDTLWKSNAYPYKTFLNANPFYTTFYQEHQRSKADSIHFTKTIMVREFLRLQDCYNHSKGDLKAKYAFYMGNFCFNLTQYGNSWLMRRYAWSNYFIATNFPDQHEYYQCDLAKSYYLKGYRSTRNKEIKALCLRMAGRCEKYRINAKNQFNPAYEFGHNDNVYKENYDDWIFAQNTYYQKLKMEFPKQYDDLISNCYSFKRYYADLKKVRK
jgi:hypothetical protein